MSLRNAVWFCVIVLVALMFFGLSPIVAEQEKLHGTFGAIVELDALVRKQFVEPMESERLVDGAIRGMMRQLDPYSGYIAADEMAAFERRHLREYVGVGVEFGMVDGAVTVIAPLEGGPAMRAGVRAGDVVLSVKGRSTDGLSVADVERLVIGEAGDSIAFVLRHRDGEELTAEVRLAAIQQSPVTGYARRGDGGWDYFADHDRRIAYIRIARFTEGMIHDFDAAVNELTARRAAGLIIDLRDNPGGLLAEAVAVADRFVALGVIVTTVTRRGALDTYVAEDSNDAPPWPLAVLINGSSASSSEIVAGSLQDHGRAVIVGQRSFGKGSVQSFFKLDGGRRGAKITVAHYQLPKGRIVHRTAAHLSSGDWGVAPDVEVPQCDTHQAAGAPRDSQLQAALDVLIGRL